MLKPDQIPDAVADSMREFFHTRGDAQRAITAALNAWPGKIKGNSLFDGEPMVFLPLHDGAEEQDEPFWITPAGTITP